MFKKEEIIDYNEHSLEIERWVELKGEQKYLEFIKLLKGNRINVKWDVLKDTYRYDKRLLINIFKYLSFYEEFLRAQLWNSDSKNSYKSLEKLYFKGIADKITNQGISLNKFKIEDKYFNENIDYVNFLRNRVSHNKIILTSDCKGKNVGDILHIFYNFLPCDYRSGYKSDINACVNNLNVQKALMIRL